MKEIEDKHYNALVEDSLMLSQIATYVENFCEGEDTTLMGVVKLLAEYHNLKCERYYRVLDDLHRHNQK